MADIYVLIYIVLAVLVFNLISLNFVFKKQKNILSNSNKYIFNKKHYTSKYISKIESKLFNLGFPYKLNLKRYLFIKFVLTTLLFIFSYLNYKELKIPCILTIVVFCIPNYLIHNHIKKEKYILINELKNIVNSLMLCLSSHTTLETALEQSVGVIKYDRLKVNYESFVGEYKMNGYKLQGPAKTLENKFKTYELTLFLGTLIQAEKEGTLLESFEKYNNTLEINYFKYLKRSAAKNMLYVTLGTVLSLVNIVAVVMYPILVQVLNNLQLIFA